MAGLVNVAGGPSNLKQPDGVPSEWNRIGQQGDTLVSGLHGRWWELSSRGMLFFAASQAAHAVSVALTTTYTGICLSNPAGNTKNLEPIMLGVGMSVANVDEAPLALGGGYTAAGVVTHTTPLVPLNAKLGVATAPTGLVDEHCTLTAAPYVIMPLSSAGGDGTFPFTSMTVFNIEGLICIPPGGYVFLYALTAVTGLFGIAWAEFPV